MSLVVRRQALPVHLEDGQHEDLGIWLVESRLISPTDHLQELGGQIRTWVQLYVAGEHVESGRGLPRHVAAHVHRVQQLLLVLVHLREADVHPRRPERAVVCVGDDLLRRWHLRQECRRALTSNIVYILKKKKKEGKEHHQESGVFSFFLSFL